MKVRWRILHAARDEEEYAHWLARYRANPPPGVRSLLNPYGATLEDLAHAATPAKVTPEEGSGSLEDARALIADERLRLSDLIDTGSGWITVANCPELLDDTQPLADRAQRLRRAKVSLAIAAVLVTIVSLIIWSLAKR